MSERLTGSPERDDLAGEYALGTLRGADRLEAEALLLRDADFAAAVAWWEARLHPLTALAGGADPPPELWSRIEAATGGTNLVSLPARRRRFWPAAAIGASAVAASLAAAVLLRPGPPEVAAVLPLAAAAPGWLATLATGRVTLQPLAGLTAQAGRDYELWALADGATAPVPVGLLATGRATTLRLPISGRFKLLVSVEPRGGSPTGLPTGPVLFGTATLIR